MTRRESMPYIIVEIALSVLCLVVAVGALLAGILVGSVMFLAVACFPLWLARLIWEDSA